MSLRKGFLLGEWTVHPLEGALERDGEIRRVQPKSMDVLLGLAEARGAVVERDVLLRQVWGERAVSDEPLTRCIGELRRALGDTRSNPRYILTVPKRGYRLLQEVAALAAEPPEVAGSDHPALTAAQRAQRFVTVRKVAAGLGVLVLAAVVQIGIERLIETPEPEEAAALMVSTVDAKSIAVLPFIDLSAAGDQEYMSDGIAEEILNLLAKIGELRVISRSSSFSLKGQSIDARTISEQFNVAYVLEGSVRATEERIRITAQLIDARTDTHIWSQTYERESGDVFSIQDQIAKAVAGRLELTLIPDTPASRPTDPDAYALFLQARYLHEQPAGDSFLRAFDYYKAALEIDESYVPAWVWLAALYDDTVSSLGLPRDEVVGRAFDAIDRALEIDPDDPMALGMSAVLTGAWKSDYATVVRQMQRAVDLDPSNPILLRWAAIALNSLSQHAEAVRIAEYLFNRDPVGNITKVNLASTYVMAGRFEDAVRICEVQVAVQSETGPCRSQLIIAYLYSGNPSGAYEQLKLAENSRAYTRLAPMVFHSLGSQQQYEAALSDLQRAYQDGDTGLAYWIARTFTFVNDADSAFEWLERAHEEGVLALRQNSAYYLNLRVDPRWGELLEKTGRRPEDMDHLRLVVNLPG